MSSNNQTISFSILSCLIKMCKFHKNSSSSKSLRKLNSMCSVCSVLSAVCLSTPEVIETRIFSYSRSEVGTGYRSAAVKLLLIWYFSTSAVYFLGLMSQTIFLFLWPNRFVSTFVYVWFIVVGPFWTQKLYTYCQN